MTRFVTSIRALALGVTLAALSAGCQVLFGDYKIDDAAFKANGAGGAGGGSAGADGNAGDAGNAGSSTVQTGPIIVMPVDGLFTTELGGQATFTIVLNAAPQADVKIALSSDNPSEGTVSPTSVVFTKDDWNAPQIVTVTGVDDTKPDGNITYHVNTAPAESTDASFAGKKAV
ncbi:MAG TPA: hypothetical protein VGL19_13170, partial [Polyangiaceae bacterium]